ncbi:MAG: WYL domain-containing protein [Bacteroidota bacterium]|nr:WYL domain-containing protein [Bacteroidota bacterium]
MAISKHPFGRYQVIDRELGRKNWVKTKELKEIIEEELSINVSERMINEDINAMKNDPLLGYLAPIEYNNTEKAYYYSDRSYTIKAFGLKEGDIAALMFYAKTINQYKEYEVFEDFRNAIEKVLDAVTIRKGISSKEHAKLIVQTENTQKLSGSELIPIIVKAIDSDSMIEFKYQKFGEFAYKLTKLEPYILKEDRQRWYIVGKVKGHEHPVTYALDRIKSLKILDIKFTRIDFDFDKYFMYSFGITVTREKPILVILSFTPYQGNYLKTLKIHHSQEILVDDDKEFRISVMVKPSWEFYEKIFGYGDSVKVISPPEIVEEMKIKSALVSKLYQ